MKTVTREDDISVLEMSVRVTNCMNRANIHTVGAFLDYPEDQFLDIRNLGKTSLDEILLLRKELLKKGFTFKHKTLEERAAEYDGSLGLNGEFDWGEPVGREVW